MHRIVRSLRDRIADNRRDMLRVGLQTAVAVALTYWVMQAYGKEVHVSWAVISALFTIYVSTDAALTSALGRIAGVFLGLGLGVVAAIVLPGPVVITLALATAAANTVATLWPTLNYAAVVVAIITLEPTPDTGLGLELAGAVMVGTLIGAATTLLVLPSFGRGRAAYVLQQTVRACREFLCAILDGVEDDDREREDAMHARFVSHLQTLHSYVRETFIRPRLPSGVPLREAAQAVESLWLTLIVLDRVVSDERQKLGPELLARIKPAVARVRDAAEPLLDQLTQDLIAAPARPPCTNALVAAASAARDEVGDVQDALVAEDGPKAKRLDALVFAFNEIERSTLRLVHVLMPGSNQPDDAPSTATSDARERRGAEPDRRRARGA